VSLLSELRKLLCGFAGNIFKQEQVSRKGAENNQKAKGEKRRQNTDFSRVFSSGRPN
jgi:hypothetical protein